MPDLAERGQLAELLCEDGVLVVERASGPQQSPAGDALWLCESRSYGKTVFDWYERRIASITLEGTGGASGASGERVGSEQGEDA